MYTEPTLEDRKAEARKSIEGKIRALGGSNEIVAACQGVSDFHIDSGKSAGTAIEEAVSFGSKMIDAGMAMCSEVA